MSEPSVQSTPMMEQYLKIKAANADCLLFYRMGDFYELFFEDAEKASNALGIALTKRGKHKGEDIPMCGVPVHTSDDYLQKLIKFGFRVAVCEQTEDPSEAKKRGSKSVVRRDVVRLVTPGTLTEDSLLDAGSNNFLVSICRLRPTTDEPGGIFGVASVDISTGAFRVSESAAVDLSTELARLDPSEIVIPEQLESEDELRATIETFGGAVVPVAKSFFDSSTAQERISKFFGVKSLEGFGQFTRAELSAAAGVVAYIEMTQLGEKPSLDAPQRMEFTSVMQIDPATRTNLELTRTLNGNRTGSLLATIDKTVTSIGSRVLAGRLASPLVDSTKIGERLDSVSFLFENAIIRNKLRDSLSQVPDMPRALSRLSLNRGGPRDLGVIRQGLIAANNIAEILNEDLTTLPREFTKVCDTLNCTPLSLIEELTNALGEELPLLKRDGNFVKSGYHSTLDEQRELRDASRKVIAELQMEYGSLVDVKSLKIKHNNVLGWFIEVPVGQSEKMLTDEHRGKFIHRQTLAGAMRFTTTKLADLESQIANAGGRAIAIELEIYDQLSEAILAEGKSIKDAADSLATVDVSAALALLASTEDYVRPDVVDSLEFEVVDGRHPVVELALRKEGSDPFVANNCNLGPLDDKPDGQIWLITGPNMAGKSTFLRQNALIAIMAQIGSFVPATFARIGVVDRLFSRVGAADDLARGRSTFMVEMVETAAILNQATDHSLVILDEIGRGTATFDGLSIAWATIENLHEVNKCRSLFATHFHELTSLSTRLERVANATVSVKEWNGEVVFLHEITSGSADRSYGIQVAKLAGLPMSVVNRAKEVLAQLEKADRQSPAETLIDDLPLFSINIDAVGESSSIASGEDELGKFIDEIDPDELTPRDALDELYKIKAKRLEIRGQGN